MTPEQTAEELADKLIKKFCCPCEDCQINRRIAKDFILNEVADLVKAKERCEALDRQVLEAAKFLQVPEETYSSRTEAMLFIQQLVSSFDKLEGQTLSTFINQQITRMSCLLVAEKERDSIRAKLAGANAAREGKPTSAPEHSLENRTTDP